MTTAVCGSCAARILWTVTDAGRSMPVDPEPVPGGNLRLDLARTPPRSSVAPAAIDLFDPADTGDRWISHFVTCPHADQHRRRHDPKQKGNP